ncbi:TB2/DP1, HVA22 family-domain-containing protein [Dichomitus squalens]|uniref:Protein YOP1 n=1 Tax=Dichomitus squalens TaxID=114155 RepID=A0A4Q9PTP8_9APHY|nr:TB2/DP1, HVA22 family-domain-containing protein [Dichomitus squalens]TBU57882.1 TB2/DP1, HVA22 family-domain-containing protein [Dichomitus squalens]
MLFYLLFRIISATAAFLYPGYASYKTLSQRPANEADLERWLMYWSVLGCIVAVESVAEWLVSWLPFYYFFKTIFLLYLALPQTSGSAWLYQTQLRPFFSAHENQIDTALAQAKVYLYTSIQRLLRRGWEQVSGAVSQGPTQSAGSSLLEEDAASHTGAPPSTHDPVSGPAQLVAGLWSTYGPSLLASGAALITQAQASAAQAAANANASAQASRSSRSRGSAEDRRRQLEAELASLGEEPAGYDVSSATSSPAFVAVQMPAPDNGSSSKSAFEEVDVPSDVEPEGGHPVSPRPDQKRTSWFGWGGASAGSGYERVKDE